MLLLYGIIYFLKINYFLYVPYDIKKSFISTCTQHIYVYLICQLFLWTINKLLTEKRVFKAYKSMTSKIEKHAVKKPYIYQ